MLLETQDINTDLFEVLEKVPNAVFIRETSAYILDYDNSFTTNIVYEDNTDKHIAVEDLVYVADKGVYVTSLIKTFCDIILYEEYITGRYWEICSQIYGVYKYGANRDLGEQFLYNEAVKRIGKDLVDDNWSELEDYYNN